jgi:hypothetical protein
MAYAVKYRLCESCDEQKSDVNFYKTIKDVCKMCRDEYTKELRQRTKEEREAIDEKRDRDIKKLKKTTIIQASVIGRMESEIRSMEKRMVSMEIGLGDLAPPKRKFGLKITRK